MKREPLLGLAAVSFVAGSAFAAERHMMPLPVPMDRLAAARGR
jgi:hypothetical protein